MQPDRRAELRQLLHTKSGLPGDAINPWMHLAHHVLDQKHGLEATLHDVMGLEEYLLKTYGNKDGGYLLTHANKVSVQRYEILRQRYNRLRGVKPTETAKKYFNLADKLIRGTTSLT